VLMFLGAHCALREGEQSAAPRASTIHDELPSPFSSPRPSGIAKSGVFSSSKDVARSVLAEAPMPDGTTECSASQRVGFAQCVGIVGGGSEHLAKAADELMLGSADIESRRSVAQRSTDNRMTRKAEQKVATERPSGAQERGRSVSAAGVPRTPSPPRGRPKSRSSVQSDGQYQL
jgi:hypothetical protein